MQFRLVKVGLTRSIAHHSLVDLIAMSDSDGIARLVRAIAEEAEIAERSGINGTFIITSESFSGLCGISQVSKYAEFISLLSKYFSIESYIFVREMASFLESMYLQTTRFGNSVLEFNDYLPSRFKWFGNLAAGLNSMADNCSIDINIEYVDGKFEILEYFERLIGLKTGVLGNVSHLVPTTAKMSLKAQVMLFHLPHIELMLGKKIDRRKMVNYLQTVGRFENDVEKFTLYEGASRQLIYKKFILLATDSKLYGYVRSFSDLDDSSNALPYHSLDLSILQRSELEEIVASANI